MEVYSPLVQQSLSKLNEDQKLTFQSTYDKKKKNKGALTALSIFFPIQLFILGKTGLGIAFLLTGGGAFVWWIIEWFLTGKRVDEFNDQLAINILQAMKTT